MKLRIRDNSVRLRLTQSEVAQFAATGRVESKTEFGGQVFYYALTSADSDGDLTSTFENGRISVKVPGSRSDRWTQTDEVGIEGIDRGVSITIEKDYMCLTARDGEDESNAFPHPKQGEIEC